MFLSVGAIITCQRYIPGTVWFSHVLQAIGFSCTSISLRYIESSSLFRYIGWPLSYGYALDNTTTDWALMYLRVYRDTLIESWNSLSKPLDRPFAAIHWTQHSGRLPAHIFGSRTIWPREWFHSLVSALKDWDEYFCWNHLVYSSLWQIDTPVRT